MSKQQEVQDAPPSPHEPLDVFAIIDRKVARELEGLVEAFKRFEARRAAAAPAVADAPLQAKYREALREHALDVFLGVVFCKVCKQVWTEGKKENHKDDCLAK